MVGPWAFWAPHIYPEPCKSLLPVTGAWWLVLRRDLWVITGLALWLSSRKWQVPLALVCPHRLHSGTTGNKCHVRTSCSSCGQLKGGHVLCHHHHFPFLNQSEAYHEVKRVFPQWSSKEPTRTFTPELGRLDFDLPLTYSDSQNAFVAFSTLLSDCQGSWKLLQRVPLLSPFIWENSSFISLWPKTNFKNITRVKLISCRNQLLSELLNLDV